jgi:hypothetical protein
LTPDQSGGREGWWGSGYQIDLLVEYTKGTWFVDFPSPWTISSWHPRLGSGQWGKLASFERESSRPDSKGEPASIY